MTASPRRRRRSTAIGAAIALGAVVVTAGLAIVGGVTLINDTDGAGASGGQAELVFPVTPTALLAAVGDAGQLASMVLLVGRPTSDGGSLVTFPVSIDASAGEGAERLPVAETFALEGVGALENEVEIALSLGVDVVEVVDATRVTSLLSTVGPIEVDLPVDATDADGEVVAAAGDRTLDPATAAAVLTARDPARPAADENAASAAVWAAVAGVGGDGFDASRLDGSGAIDALFSQVMSGAVGHRPLTTTAADAATNPRRVDVALLDRVELALVLGQIAPGKVSAPNPGLTFRVESRFEEAALTASGLTATEAAYEAVAQLLFVRGNVLSVDSTPGEVPDVTQIEVSDASLLTGFEAAEQLLGPVEISVAEGPIAGVDVIVRLGSSFLEQLGSRDTGG